MSNMHMVIIMWLKPKYRTISSFTSYMLKTYNHVNTCRVTLYFKRAN